MLLLAFRNLSRRPLRSMLAVAGLAMAIGVLTCLWAFGHGYERALGTELDRMGMQMMLVPLGCPYDAAARVLKGKTLENSLPDSVLQEARRDPAVAVAAPLLLAAVPNASAGRTDMWVGLDETALALKPWWKAKAGARWFAADDSVILGCDAAEVEMRASGDLFLSPETGQKLRVAGVLERSGTSDDSLFFVPLSTAQKMFAQPNRLTAVAIRLRDPALLREASQRLQSIPGAQVVTMTEMLGTFLNLVGSVRTLLVSIALVAVVVSVLSVFNTLLAAVVERTRELAVMRAIGASRLQIVGLITLEALLLTGAGTLCGILLAVAGGPGIEHLVKGFVPMAPAEALSQPTARVFLGTLLLGALVGVLSGLYPAWRASQLQPAEALKTE
jgi:putative ABC transport system permease protein